MDNDRVSHYVMRILHACALLLVLSSCAALPTWTDTAHPWRVESIEHNTVRITVTVGSSTCDRFERVEVSETEMQVRITAVVAEKTDSGLIASICTDDLGFKPVDVVLDRPIGARALTGCTPGGQHSRDCADPIG